MPIPFFFGTRQDPTQLGTIMDKKAKKRLEVLRQKVQKTEKLLVAAREQPDEPGEAERIAEQLSQYKAEIAEIKSKS